MYCSAEPFSITLINDLYRRIHALPPPDDLSCTELMHDAGNTVPGPATDQYSQTVLLRLRTDNAMLMLLGHIVDLDIVQGAPAQAVLQNQPGSFGMDMHFDYIADNS